MISRLVFLLPLAALFLPLRAQDEPIHMRPEFPLIFPLDQNGKDVTVKYPVLVNPATVIKPGMILRVIYILNHDQSGNSDLIIAHKGTMEQAYARGANEGGGDNGPKLSPEVAHEIEGYRRTDWQESGNFVMAMAQYPTNLMHLIYTPTGKSADIQDERFSFFDGLFVGSPNGRVSVVAVEKGSKTDAAGIKSGDEIVSVGGYGTKNDLATFASAYAAAKRDATQNEAESYPMIIRSQGKGDTVTCNIPMPMKIKGGLMNGFFDKPDTAPPKPASP